MEELSLIFVTYSREDVPVVLKPNAMKEPFEGLNGNIGTRQKEPNYDERDQAHRATQDACELSVSAVCEERPDQQNPSCVDVSARVDEMLTMNATKWMHSLEMQCQNNEWLGHQGLRIHHR
jgi:hypothetical protein